MIKTNTTNTTNINGYIEGYYGRLINWPERHLILKKLKETKLNSFFYCPKEDLNHRLNWRRKYTKTWMTSFNNFCESGKKLNINILIGISPGLDYKFENNNEDFNILVTKAKDLKNNGANKIVLMFDDIPEYFVPDQTKSKPEGLLHAELANRLFKELEEIIYVVPRVYSDELINENYTYLSDFNKVINSSISIFYCGKKIVSDTNQQFELETIKKTTLNKIIFWDNLFANDYCPKKIFLGPWLGRNNLDNIMFNLTGMIETDLFLLELISLTTSCNNHIINWENILIKYKIPKQFLLISEYFFPINYNIKKFNKDRSYTQEIDALDFLLWKWKTPLSREWYQYLLILKQDLQLFNGELDSNRIKKIFPIPLYNAIIKKWGK